MDRFWFSVIRPCLSCIGARTIAEIGTGGGATTLLLAAYCKEHNARLHTIDTNPQINVRTFEETHAPYVLCYRGLSLDVLPHIPAYDALLIDGDHNWYTVFHELQLVERRQRETGMQPVVFLHDTGWPYARRDLYYDISLIPEDYRQESEVAGIDAVTDALSPVGLNPAFRHARKSGGERNGVLTAVEDFLHQHPDWTMVTVQGLFGLSILVPEPLLRKHPDFLDFLKSLVPSDALEQHIKLLEEHRVQQQMLASSLRRTNDRLLMMAAEKDRDIQALAEDISAPDTAKTLQIRLERMEHTMSWKLTAPLRIAGSLLRQDMSTYCKLWIHLGRPFPRTVRFLRHRLLARFLPDTIGIVEEAAQSHTTVVVVCSTTAMFLQDTLESLLSQSSRPAEIIVVGTQNVRDDLAGAVLPYLGKEIRFLHDSFENATAGVRAAISLASGEFVLCMHSGDLLQQQCIECGEDWFRVHPSAGLVASDIQTFGAKKEYHRAPDAARGGMPCVGSLIGSGVMIRRETLEQAGGWPANETQSVWHAMQQLGWTLERSSGLYLKRAGNDDKEEQSLVPAAVCLSLSGRSWAWPMTKVFLETQTYPHNLLHLVIVDTADDATFSADVRQWLATCDYKQITYKTLPVGIKDLASLPRHTVTKEVSVVCAALYNTFARMVDTPLVFTLEDDVIPPPDAFVRLSTLMTDDVVSASALYWHRDKNQPVCWTWDRGGPSFPEKGTGIQEIGGTGFGCLAINGEIFRNTVFRSGQPFGNYDHNFFAAQTMHGPKRALIDWDCVCRHYQSPDVWF